MSESSTVLPTDENFDPTDAEIASAEKWARANPNNLPPQFGGDPDKFVKSYKDMRATLTKAQQELAATKKTQTETTTPPADPGTGSAPVDKLSVPDKPQQPSSEEWSRWGQELVSTGNLSPETRQTIKQKFGMPDEVIDGYVSGIVYRQREHANRAAEVVGGQEQLKSIITWAQQTLSDDERTAVNSALASPGWQNVLLGLKTRMLAQNPTNGEPARASGSSQPSPGIVPFANKREMTHAIRDPRYKYDPAYQQMVQQRIIATGTIKTDR